ncbi:MAG: HAD family phosphatase [Salegentibacter sp.]
MPEIIIFDMDGVLVDSEPLHKELEQQLFKELDLQITPAYYNQLVGTSPRQMWERITSDFELQIPVDELLQREKELKLSEIRKLRLQLNKGVEALLKDLKKNEFRLSVGSSSPKKIIELFLEKTGIAHLFDHAVSSEEVTHGKPAPDIFLRIASLYEIAPEGLVVVEDSRNGVVAAKAAGMRCIGYVNANSGEQDLSQADLLVERFEELSPQVFQKIRKN